MDPRELNDFAKGVRFSSATGTRLVSREGASFEFKESFNWNSKDKYGKTAAAFANNRGGYIIFGIKDKPREVTGLRSTNFEEVDEATITQYLNSVFSPEIEFDKAVHHIRGMSIGILFFRASGRRPVVAIKNDGDIREGEIYYRYTARNEKIKFPELRMILDHIQDVARRHWTGISPVPLPFSRQSSH